MSQNRQPHRVTEVRETVVYDEVMKIHAAIEEAKDTLRHMSISALKKRPMSTNAQGFYSDIHKEFVKLLEKPGKCHRCGCISPQWKKEGVSVWRWHAAGHVDGI